MSDLQKLFLAILNVRANTQPPLKKGQSFAYMALFSGVYFILFVMSSLFIMINSILSRL